jgi:lysophospholipase L1-like esterase
MPTPFSSREKRLLTGLLFFAGIAGILTADEMNRASSHVGFLGDSLTVMWAFPRANLGIPGQTTSEVLARFNDDVPNQGYRKVIILSGTNDILHHVDPGITLANLETMANLTQQAHAEPILAELPPIFRDNGEYLPAVQSLNARIVQLATRRGFKIVDYYDPLTNHPGEFVDGVHLKRSAYLRLELALIRTTNPF